MFNWFDLMRQAQGGAGLDNMARQFGLRPEQVQLAVAALLPAFAIGLQRSSASPNAMMQLFQLMTTGQYANFFESASQAFSAEGRREGQAIVDRLFGSDEVARRVAQQAAQFSGIGTEVLNQLLPLVAAILAGGMYKVLTGQGAMLGSMPDMWRMHPGQGVPSYGGVPNPWAEAWKAWAAGMTPPSDSPSPQAPPANPFQPMMPFQAMMAPFLVRPPAPEPPQPEPEPEPESAESRSAPNPLEAWGQWFEKGQEMQKQHLESLQSIFDTAWGRQEKP